jgi:hypothetical protein
VHLADTRAHPATTSLSPNKDQRPQCSHFLTTHMGRTTARKQRTAEPLSATETDMTRAQKPTIALNRQLRASLPSPHPRHGGSRFLPPACAPRTHTYTCDSEGRTRPRAPVVHTAACGVRRNFPTLTCAPGPLKTPRQRPESSESRPTNEPPKRPAPQGTEGPADPQEWGMQETGLEVLSKAFDESWSTEIGG